MKSSTAKGLAIGLAVAVLVPMVLPVVGRAARPLGRAAAKTGLLLMEKGRETFAEMGEVVDDFIAETQAELETEAEVAEEAVEEGAEVAEEKVAEARHAKSAR